MILAQTLQGVLDGLKALTRRDFSILERNGKVIATTQAGLLNTKVFAVEDFVQSAANSQTVKGYQYFKAFNNGICEYIIYVCGEEEEAYMQGKLAAFQIEGLIVAYKERFSRSNFIKNLLLDNLLLVDIHAHAKKLSIEASVRRAVYLFEVTDGDENTVSQKIKDNFMIEDKDFIAILDKTHVILVKELKKWEESQEIEKYAQIVSDALSMDAEKPVRVGIGVAADELQLISRSYKEAKMALEVGEIFETGQIVTNYKTLGLLRLIYQLPKSLCKIFIEEVLGNTIAESFDEETLSTIDAFFTNNLNVSEAARQLFIHRNTLVYRLDKLQKITGLDLRSFDSAIIFKITLMVSKYLKYKDAHNIA
ncbi:MAG: helix-turn-helix domain-containing protein [Defluviitaleaceae bacterium]|nr:helix-turn-helix domain-containing protein [Defluviitaleaceae bacterium]